MLINNVKLIVCRGDVCVVRHVEDRPWPCRHSHVVQSGEQIHVSHGLGCHCYHSPMVVSVAESYVSPRLANVLCAPRVLLPTLPVLTECVRD
jgi:hypothetical protein